MIRRKVSASFFLITMSFLVVFQLPVFAYCFCVSEIVSAPCHCENSQEVSSSCPSQGEKSQINISSSERNCDQIIDLDTDHFLSQAKDHAPAAPGLLAICPPLDFSSMPSFGAQNKKLTLIRGSPPVPSQTPLYLKHSVFRL